MGVIALAIESHSHLENSLTRCRWARIVVDMSEAENIRDDVEGHVWSIYLDPEGEFLPIAENPFKPFKEI